MILETYQLGDKHLEVTFRRNSRAKRATLRVDTVKERLLVTLPQRVPEDNAWELIRQAEAWIIKQLAQGIKPIPFAPDVDIPVFGIPHRIQFQEFEDLSFERLSVEQHQQSKTVIIKGYTPQVLPTLMMDWLWGQIQDYTTKRIQFFAQNIGKTVVEVNIKDLKSRWGSCSSRNNISLSWRLVFAPHKVVDYVCAHEVAHLREMNHSKHFWNIVAELCPDYKDHRLWLRQNSARLQSYGVPINE
ncbi:MAG: SprT family zinc-dependent metalloprotease [Pseudomonadota bacterium]